MATSDTLPAAGDCDEQDAVIVEASVRDDKSGAMWVHKDLVQVVEPWTHEQHIGPIKASEQFGDVESWTAYIKRFGDLRPFLTWNSNGLRAVLDYHEDDGGAGRAQWTASYPFERSPEWKAWSQFATGSPVPHKLAIEFLEDHAPDIVDPAPADLADVLRNLRANVNTTANTELKPDGTTNVFFEQNKALRSAQGGSVELPHEFTIGIPILKGHVDGVGKAVVYRLGVRIRASVDDSAHLALRFSIPNAERALEAVFYDRVAEAHRLLGADFDVLRAAG